LSYLDEFVEVKSRGGDLFVLLDEDAIVLDQFLSVLHNLIVDVERAWAHGALLGRHFIELF
jgi:hypothetical protein